MLCSTSQPSRWDVYQGNILLGHPHAHVSSAEGFYLNFQSVLVVNKRLFVVALQLVHVSHFHVSIRHAHMWMWR